MLSHQLTPMFKFLRLVPFSCSHSRNKSVKRLLDVNCAVHAYLFNTPLCGAVCCIMQSRNKCSFFSMLFADYYHIGLMTTFHMRHVFTFFWCQVLNLVEQLSIALNDEFRVNLPVLLPRCVAVLTEAERTSDYRKVPPVLHTFEVLGGELACGHSVLGTTICVFLSLLLLYIAFCDFLLSLCIIRGRLYIHISFGNKLEANILVVLSTSMYLLSRSRQQILLGCCLYAHYDYQHIDCFEVSTGA